MPPQQTPAGSATAQEITYPSMDDVISVPDSLLTDLADGKAAGGAAGPATAGEGEKPAAAGPATEERFVLLPNGQKLKLGADGAVDPAAFKTALSESHVPIGEFHREVQRARGPDGRFRPLEGDRPAAPAKPKAEEPKPFARVANPHTLEDSPAEWYKHERDQDIAQNEHWRAEREREQQSVLEQIRVDRARTQIQSSLDREFDTSLPKVGVDMGDAAPIAKLREGLWHIVAQDPRNHHNPNAPEDARMTGEEILREHWGLIKGYADHMVAVALNKLKQSAEGSTASPHSGGTASMATDPKRIAGASGNPRDLIQPTPEGMKPYDAFLLDLKRGVRPPGR